MEAVHACCETLNEERVAEARGEDTFQVIYTMYIKLKRNHGGQRSCWHLTLDAHAQQGYGTFCVCVCLSVTALAATNFTHVKKISYSRPGFFMTISRILIHEFRFVQEVWFTTKGL